MSDQNRKPARTLGGRPALTEMLGVRDARTFCEVRQGPAEVDTDYRTVGCG